MHVSLCPVARVDGGMGTGRPTPYQTRAMAHVTSAKRPRERSMVRSRQTGMRRIAASRDALNQILWFVRVRSDKERNCRWTDKICGLTTKMSNSRVGLVPMLRRNIRSAAALLAGGILLASTLTASAQQQSGGQKPPEQAQGEQRPDDQKAAEQAKAEQQAQQKAIDEYKEAAEKLTSSAGAPECVWTGRRI